MRIYIYIYTYSVSNLIFRGLGEPSVLGFWALKPGPSGFRVVGCRVRV